MPRAPHRRRAARPAPAWRVEVEAHEVARWSIEAQTLEVRAINDVQARIAATHEVQRSAGVAPWKPWLRFTYLRTRVVTSIGQELPETRSAGGSRPAHNLRVSPPEREELSRGR